jgi:hypothetical protein
VKSVFSRKVYSGKTAPERNGGTVWKRIILSCLKQKRQEEPTGDVENSQTLCGACFAGLDTEKSLSNQAFHGLCQKSQSESVFHGLQEFITCFPHFQKSFQHCFCHIFVTFQRS